MLLETVALAFAIVLSACVAAQPETQRYILRLEPGQEVKTELARLAKERQLKAASIVSAVGSLTGVGLRLANKPDTMH